MSTPGSQPPDMALEVVVIPVADVERSMQFYGGLGWRLDADLVQGDAFRLVQYTPPASACSIHFGKGVTEVMPGSASNLYLVVPDIAVAREELVKRGVDVSEVFHRSPGGPKVVGEDPEHHSYASFVSFSDPDGNPWLVQEITARLPGRVKAGAAAFRSTSELAAALRRAAAAHGMHEKRTGQHDDNWQEWYADYMLREQASETLPL